MAKENLKNFWKNNEAKIILFGCFAMATAIGIVAGRRIQLRLVRDGFKQRVIPIGFTNPIRLGDMFTGEELDRVIRNNPHLKLTESTLIKGDWLMINNP